jgi:hypothetical protein
VQAQPDVAKQTPASATKNRRAVPGGLLHSLQTLNMLLLDKACIIIAGIHVPILARKHMDNGKMTRISCNSLCRHTTSLPARRCRNEQRSLFRIGRRPVVVSPAVASLRFPAPEIMADAPPSAESAAAVPTGFVRLVSNDDHDFLIEDRFARISPVIVRMLDGTCWENLTKPMPYQGTWVNRWRPILGRQLCYRHANALYALTTEPILTSFSCVLVCAGDFRESRTRTIALPYKGPVLEILCQYLHYHNKHRNASQVPGGRGTSEQMPSMPSIPEELLKDVLMASAYLDI